MSKFLGVWESVYNPNFNYGEFAIIKSQAGLACFLRSCAQKKAWNKNAAVK